MTLLLNQEDHQIALENNMLTLNTGTFETRLEPSDWSVRLAPDPSFSLDQARLAW